MGYTHYWTHRRRFTNAEWEEVKADINEIIRHTDVVIADGRGEKEVRRVDKGDTITLNGLNADSHETFEIYQNRRPLQDYQTREMHGWDFCKTNRKPYDVVVTAILCYLESCWNNRFSTSSDGDLDDWTAGLELARRALPTKTNMLHYPFDLKWEAQFRHGGIFGKNYQLREAVTGELAITKGQTILAYFPADISREVTQKILDRKPNFGIGDSIGRKTDQLIRNLLTQPEVILGD